MRREKKEKKNQPLKYKGLVKKGKRPTLNIDDSPIEGSFFDFD